VGSVARRIDDAADADVVADLQLRDIRVCDRDRHPHLKVIQSFDSHLMYSS